MSGYTYSEKRGITIFGGYQTRTILDEKGQKVATVAFLANEPEAEIQALLNNLNRKEDEATSN